MNDKQRKAYIQKIVQYNAKNMKQIKINLNRLNPTDVAIINYLEQNKNVQGLIKDLLLKHMREEGIECPSQTKPDS